MFLFEKWLKVSRFEGPLMAKKIDTGSQQIGAVPGETWR